VHAVLTKLCPRRAAAEPLPCADDVSASMQANTFFCSDSTACSIPTPRRAMMRQCDPGAHVLTWICAAPRRLCETPSCATSPLPFNRIYSDGRSKDFKQGWVSWIIAIVTMTIYTGGQAWE
jgi:hypothetical protein